MTQAFLDTASLFPDRGVLYVKADRTEQFTTYASLSTAARQVVTGLRDHALAPRDAVILQLDDLSLLHTAFWGCVLGGFIPVIVAVPSTSEKDNGLVNKLRGAWELLGRPAVLCQERSRAHLRQILSNPAGETPDLRTIALEEVTGGAPALRIHHSEPDDVLFYQLTSGSTGIPKCIQETH